MKDMIMTFPAFNDKDDNKKGENRESHIDCAWYLAYKYIDST